MMMEAIYRIAREVVIWPGKETLDTKVMLEELPAVLSRLQLAPKGTSGRRGVGSIEDINNDDNLGGLRELFTQPYWSHLWVLQEAVLARSATFICGSSQTSWAELQRLAKEILAVRLNYHSPRLERFHNVRGSRWVQRTQQLVDYQAYSRHWLHPKVAASMPAENMHGTRGQSPCCGWGDAGTHAIRLCA